MNWRAIQKALHAPAYVGRLKHGEADVLGRPVEVAAKEIGNG